MERSAAMALMPDNVRLFFHSTDTAIEYANRLGFTEQGAHKIEKDGLTFRSNPKTHDYIIISAIKFQN